MLKRSLALGGAAIALGLSAGAAHADTKFDVMVGGDAFFQFGYVDQNLDAGLRSTEMRNRFRLVVTPSAKADNGLEYGARLRIRADAPSTASAGNHLRQDRAYMFAKGAFGTLQGGTINGLSDEYGIIGPNVEGIAGSADNNPVDYLGGAAAGVAYRSENFRTLNSGNAITRINYLTPTFAGFTGGISYAPRTDDSNNSINRQKYAAVAGFGSYAPSFQDIVEIGATYAGEFSGVTVEASGFYEFGSATKETMAGTYNAFKSLSSYSLGANIGYAGFKFGGMYTNSGKSGYCKAAGCGGADQETWMLGANYTMGPIIVAANYQHYKDAADPSVPGNSKMDLYGAGVTYTVAPGLTTGLEYNYFRTSESELAVKDKGSIIILDTRLAF